MSAIGAPPSEIPTDTCRACMIQNDQNEMIFLFEGSDVGKTFSKCTSLEVNFHTLNYYKLTFTLIYFYYENNNCS